MTRLALNLAAAAIFGIAFDSALVGSGWLIYENGSLWTGTAPYWIVAMWLLFATTLNVSLRWLRARACAAALFGAIGGPISYVAGAQLGAVELVSRGAALAALSLGWAFVVPVLIALSRHFDGMQADAQVVNGPTAERAHV